MKEHKERRRIPITETKGFLKIEEYSGETNKQQFRQWKHQVVNLMGSHEPELRNMLQRVERETDIIELD
eukprot:3788803-Heterocapsa_arctica.AAC.1